MDTVRFELRCKPKYLAEQGIYPSSVKNQRFLPPVSYSAIATGNRLLRWASPLSPGGRFAGRRRRRPLQREGFTCRVNLLVHILAVGGFFDTLKPPGVAEQHPGVCCIKKAESSDLEIQGGIFVIPVLPFYDAAVCPVERGRTFEFRIAYSHVRADRGSVNGFAEEGDSDFGQGG